MNLFGGNFIMFCKELSNGLRYWRQGGRGFCLGAEKTRSQPVLDGQSSEKCLKMPQNPRRPVHAMLYAIRYLALQNACQYLCAIPFRAQAGRVASRLVVLVVSASKDHRQSTGRCRSPRARVRTRAPNCSAKKSVPFPAARILSSRDR